MLKTPHSEHTSPRTGKSPKHARPEIATSGRPYYDNSWDALAREKDMVVPSGMPSGTTLSDLPTVPPPVEFWKLKYVDHTARAMDYWDKTHQRWDIAGIQSDMNLTLRTSTTATPDFDYQK